VETCPFPDCGKTFNDQPGLPSRTRLMRHISAVHGKKAVEKLVEQTCATRATCTEDDPTGEICPCEMFCYR